MSLARFGLENHLARTQEFRKVPFRKDNGFTEWPGRVLTTAGMCPLGWRPTPKALL